MGHWQEKEGAVSEWTRPLGLGSLRQRPRSPARAVMGGKSITDGETKARRTQVTLQANKAPILSWDSKPDNQAPSPSSQAQREVQAEFGENLHWG